MKVLIVDDSESVRQSLRQQLEELGFDTVEAENGYDALERLATPELPQIAFVDRQMPLMDGLQLVSAVRADDRFNDMRIVMCSGPLTAEQASQLPALAIDCYIPKPFPRGAVATAVRSLCPTI